MKKMLLLFSLGLLLIGASVSAQKANIDSLKLVAQISEDQLRLGKLENRVDQKTKNKQNAAYNAQNSADNNATAAEKLIDDPDNKALARNANSKAGDAKSDARKSRKESGKLDNLYKNIRDLKGKIANEEAQLGTYYPTSIGIPVVAITPVQSDTTQHL
jgi:hypothetical protein